jgi:hypothetical protein
MQALGIVNCRKHRPARPDCPECCACRPSLRVTAGCVSAMDDASSSCRKVPRKGRGGCQRDGDRLSGGKPDGRPIAGCSEADRLAGRLASRPALRPRRPAAAGGMSRASGTTRPTAWAVARAGHVAAGNYSAGKEANERSKGALTHVRGTRQRSRWFRHLPLTSVIAEHARYTTAVAPSCAALSSGELNPWVSGSLQP